MFYFSILHFCIQLNSIKNGSKIQGGRRISEDSNLFISLVVIHQMLLPELETFSTARIALNVKMK